MKALFPLLFALPALAIAAPNSPSKNWIQEHPSAVKQFNHPSHNKPINYVGLAIGPFEGSPERAAQQFLEQSQDLINGPLDSLHLRRVIPIGPALEDGYGRGGAVLRYRQGDGERFTDSDVLSVYLDSSGMVRSLQQSMLTPPREKQAAVSLSQALAVAKEKGFEIAESQSILGWWPVGDNARLAWRLYHSPSSTGLIHRLVIDATTGRLLNLEQLTHSDGPLADVYLLNPWLEEQPTQVELPEELSGGLTGDRHFILSSEDKGALQTFTKSDGTTINCHVVSVAIPPGPVDGIYDYEAIPYPVDPAQDEDAFAAPHLYHTVNQGLLYFKDFGIEELRGEPLKVISNAKWPNALDADALVDPEGPLAPLNNAYFSPSYESSNGVEVASLTFGQGTHSDFAYDADVVYHELGHGIVDTVGGPTSSVADIYGLSLEPYALNEGFSDYFSSAIQGDGQVGEYAALAWNSDGNGIRNLDDFASCPENLIGQQHNDSTIFTSALWEVRKGLEPQEQQTYDLALFAALSSMSGSAQFEEAATVSLERVGELLGSTVQGTLQGAFDARGVLNCKRFIDVDIAGLDNPVFSYTPITGPSNLGSTQPAPANLQFKLELPAGKQKVTIQFLQSEYKGVPLKSYGYNRVPQDMVIYANAASPITYNVQATEDRVDMLLESGQQVAQARLIDGADLLESTSYYYYTYRAEWYVDDLPGEYYIQLANNGFSTTYTYDIAFAAEEVDEIPGESGCNRCDSTGGSSSPLALMALFLLWRSAAFWPKNAGIPTQP